MIHIANEGIGERVIQFEEEHFDILRAGERPKVAINKKWIKENWGKLTELRDNLYLFADRTASPLFVINPPETRKSMRQATQLLREMGF